MKRTITHHLLDWKKDSQRVPLIIRGARQVGKSFAVEAFGHDHFDSVAVANFEKREELQYSFQSFEPKKILERLEFYLQKRIIPGKTLLFLDEIQLCPKALTALRYFKEEMPELHIIAAGSLLEFTLEDQQFSFPVGRVAFLFMRPMSFIEYLEAIGETRAIQLLKTISLSTPIDTNTHNLLLERVRDYFWVGGMPEVVSVFRKEHSLKVCVPILDRQLETFNQDFGKYAKKGDHQNLKRLFERAPAFVGNHFRYSKIDPHTPNPARDYKRALIQLNQAGLINQVFDTRANGIPLLKEINEKKFKTLFLDIGLMQSALQITDWKEEVLLDLYEGALAEQFVGQELLAYSDPHRNQKLFFWESQKKGSSAEVDYLKVIDSQIVPIEVKAGTTGRLRSLKCFMENKRIRLGVRISERELNLEQNILSVPMYLISELPRLLKEASMRI